MSTKQLLMQARELIIDPSHWTQGAAARDARGRGVFSDAPEACMFCVIGSIWRAAGSRTGKDVYLAEHALERVVPDGYVASFNDSHSHAEVIAMFDRAIASLPSEG